MYWLSGNILIDRKNGKKASSTLELSAQKIQEKQLSIWMFPEGTRSYGKGILPFKTGAFRLAQQANVPVVMITASDLHNKIKLNRWNNGEVIVEMSDPVLLDESQDIRSWADQFHQQMEQKFAQLNQQTQDIKK
jgi:1-acyl-sn-glycerol-3-phosphate acyltransferase